MSENRNEQVVKEQLNGTVVLAADALQRVVSREPEAPARPEERIPLFWHIFGGTVLSIVALVAITLYQQLSSGLGDLRSDLGHLDTEVRGELKQLHEAHNDVVTREEVNGRINEFNTRSAALVGGLKDVQAATTAALAQRAAALEQQVKTAEEEHKEMTAELQRLRERLATLEARATQVRR